MKQNFYGNDSRPVFFSQAKTQAEAKAKQTFDQFQAISVTLKAHNMKYRNPRSHFTDYGPMRTRGQNWNCLDKIVVTNFCLVCGVRIQIFKAGKFCQQHWLYFFVARAKTSNISAG